MNSATVFSMEPNEKPNTHQVKGTARKHDVAENLIELGGVVSADIHGPKHSTCA